MRKGFTLIELLVVIVIIGILATFFINSSLINIKRGRDARRKTDLENIRSGIETFFSDCDHYPITSAITAGVNLVGDGSTANCAAANIYIKAIPDDPTSTRNYLYYRSSNTTYVICAALETGSGTVTCNGSSACGSSTCNYQVSNP